MINKNLKNSYIKKYLLKKKKKLLILSNENFLGHITANFLRTTLGSIAVILFFFIVPTIIEFKGERKISSSEYKNTSSNDLKKVLETIDENLVTKDLYNDVLSFEELPDNTVRLSASTIEQIFKETKYSLKDVRKNKLVKPVSLQLLPKEIKQIENVKKRKDLFIQIILPLIIEENTSIRIDRRKLFKILNKNNNTKPEKKWLTLKFKQYGVANKDLATLKIRMDEIPVSMAIAQAAKETGWGTSRFALEGNALFGQWTWTGEGIRPSGAKTDSTHKVMKFKVLQASVKAYHRNLNTHSSYRGFRSERAELRDKNKTLDSIILSEYLDKYAETGKEYVRILQQIIKQNQLKDFDDAKLLPSSIDLKSLI